MDYTPNKYSADRHLDYVAAFNDFISTTIDPENRNLDKYPSPLNEQQQSLNSIIYDFHTAEPYTRETLSRRKQLATILVEEIKIMCSSTLPGQPSYVPSDYAIHQFVHDYGNALQHVLRDMQQRHNTQTVSTYDMTNYPANIRNVLEIVETYRYRVYYENDCWEQIWKIQKTTRFAKLFQATSFTVEQANHQIDDVIASAADHYYPQLREAARNFIRKEGRTIASSGINITQRTNAN